MDFKSQAKQLITDKKHKEALTLLLDNADANFGDAELFKLIGDCYHETGQERRMLNHWRRAKRLGYEDEGLDISSMTHGLKAQVMGKPDEVIEDKTCLDLFTKGNKLFAEQKYDEALAAFADAHKAAPQYYTPLLNAALCHYKKGDLDNAIAMAKKATEAKSDSALAWYNLGTFHNKKEDWTNAIPAFEKCTILDGEDPDYWYNYGFALYHTGKYKDAARVLKEGSAASPEHTNILWHRALAHMKLGEHDTAVQLLRNVLSLVPNWKSYAKKQFTELAGNADFEKLVA